ncbi:hypothetical protein DL89DRAFT_265376 [Linderina pennispora]|uniref:MARVEL domain-containing protein n=1 Tax=Linderina pennispora TaxID=61395 RepID=A0A1Y1WI43_9FUNG|nr:uncharacterized protein DL89DRAFT_265376 [Linderina pennispora]KAJ1931429.1 hypothetical protein EC988_009791 [Linderina pennispora]ORX73240.1 hypothetical protein DL89DRAFT_265376 [Linderina pennispora]
MQLAFISPGCATTCQILSVFGIIFLLILGALFKAEVHELTSSTEDPADPKAVGHACFVAAGIYAAFLVCCTCQNAVRSADTRRARRL